MTITYPEKIYTAKKNVWQWIPTIANLTTGPTVAEWNAGFATQCSYDADQMQYTVTADTQESQRYCDEFATVAPGRKSLSFPDVEVYVDPQKPTDAGYKLATAWIPEPTGSLALRAGVDATTAAAATQVVSMIVPVKIVSLLLRAPNPAEAQDTYKWKFQILPQGDPIVNRTLSA